MKNASSRGLVLFNRPYRERDMIVKIFTESFGKRMFFVKNAGKSRLTSSLQPFTAADFLMTVNDSGFSFLSDISEVKQLKNISESLTENAYASYVISLADEAVPDGEFDPALFDFLIQILDLMNEDIDAAILTNIFEIQILSRFGVSLDFTSCMICGRKDLPMDFSAKHDGCICRNHFSEDLKRYQLDPNVLYLCGQFQSLTLEKLKKISLRDEMKEKLRVFLDSVYERYVGVYPRAKRFLDDMQNWKV